MSSDSPTTLRIHVAYNGSRYHGWQIQRDAQTVEGELTRAVTRILNAPDPVKVQGASRTDAGVHAIGQVAHFRHATGRRPWDFARGLNALTDKDITVVRVEPVPPTFHARHSARGKIYRYRVWNHRFDHPFEGYRCWQMGLTLDTERMQKVAAALIGTHDFGAFRASDCEASTTERTLRRVEILRSGAMVDIVVEGDAFLKYMVRILVGTLVDIGTGSLDPRAIDQMLATQDRTRGGQTAPARGLTLEQVFYPDFPWIGSEPFLGGPFLPTFSDSF